MKYRGHALIHGLVARRKGRQDMQETKGDWGEREQEHVLNWEADEGNGCENDILVQRM